MHRAVLILAAVVLGLLVVRDSWAARFTPLLDPLETALQQRVDNPETSAKLRKLYGKHLKKLAKTTTSLAQDVGTAAKIIPAIEKKAAADAALQAIAGTTVDALEAAVAAYLAEVEAQANALPGKNAIVIIGNFLGKARVALGTAQGGGTLVSRIQSLRKAVTFLVKTVKVILNAGGGGGGGGGVCGPTPRPAGLRALAQGESATGDANEPATDVPARQYAFTAGSVVARAGPKRGIVGLPTVLEVRLYDCTARSCAALYFPYPPVVGQTYTGANGADVDYQFDWDGFTQVCPGGCGEFKVTAFDAEAKTITFEFDYPPILTNGVVTLKNWTGP